MASPVTVPPLALQEREQAIAESSIAVAASGPPLWHCGAGDAAPAVVGSKPAPRGCERYQRSVCLTAAPGAPMPRLFTLRGDRRHGVPQWPQGRWAGENERVEEGVERRSRGGAAMARRRAASGDEAAGGGPRAPSAKMAPGTVAETRPHKQAGAPLWRPSPLAVR